MKLTAAQKRVLEQIDLEGSFSCVPEYKPAQALIRLGLVEAKKNVWGNLTLTRSCAAEGKP